MSDNTVEAVATGPDSPDLLGRWFWVETPVRVARYAPTFASALSDGQYFLRWSPLSWLVVIGAFLTGVITELVQNGEVFSTSWLVIVALSSLGLLSVQLGCYGLLGYIGADLLTGRTVGRGFTRQWWAPLGDLLSIVTEYLILAGAVIAVPLLVLALRIELRRREIHKLVGPAGERFANAVAVFALYYIWCQSTVSSIRTVYRPVDARIPVDAVFNTQERWHFIAGALVLVTVARWLLERAAVREESIIVLRETTERFEASARTTKPSIYRRLSFQLIVGLLLLGGIIDYLWQVPVTIAVIVTVTLLRDVLPRTAIGAAIARIPLIARFGLAAVLVYLILSAVAEPSRDSFLRRSDFLAMWGSVLFSYALVGSITIRARMRPETEQPDKADSEDRDGESRNWPPPTSATGLVLIVVIVGATVAMAIGATANAASADNCSGLTDCWGTSESFLLALGILLLVLGIALILSPAIVLATPALVTSGGLVIGASVTIPAATLTTAGIGTAVAGTGLIVGTQADDLITLATSSEGAGRGDAHGDSGRELSKVEERIRQAQEELAELNRTQGPKKDKDRLKRLIENLRRAAERARKGETHGRQGRGQQN